MGDGGLISRRALRINSGGTLPSNPVVSDVFAKTGSDAGFYLCLVAGAWTGPFFGFNGAGVFVFVPYFYGSGNATAALNVTETNTGSTNKYRLGIRNELTVSPMSAPGAGGFYSYAAFNRVLLPSTYSYNTSNIESYGAYSVGQYDGAGNISGRLYGSRSEGRVTNAGASSGTWGIYGAEAGAIIDTGAVLPRFSSAAISASISNASSVVHPNGNGTTALYLLTGGTTHTGSVPVNEIGCVNVKNTGAPQAGGTVALLFGIRINQPSTALNSFVTTNIGLDIADHSTVGTNKYNIYSRGVNSVNHFEGAIVARSASVIDEAYGSGWNGSLETPTKNALYDKLQDALQVKSLSAPFDMTDETLEDIPGLSTDVQAGGSYSFQLSLPVNADVSGGYAVALGGSATATLLFGQGFSYDTGSVKLIGAGTYSSLGAAQISEAGTENTYVTMSGSIIVSAAGTFVPQFAQHTRSGTSSVIAGATFEVKRVG